MQLINETKLSAFSKTNAFLLYSRVVAFVLLSAVATAATVKDNEILYIGGTAGSIPNRTKGRFALLDKEEARFISVQGSFEIPYKQVTRIGYGEKVSRRILEALAINVVFIFSKRHQHFVTLQYFEQDKTSKIAVFEIGKDNVHSVVTVFENRTHIKCEFESNQAAEDFRKTDFQPKTAPESEGKP